MTTAYCTSCGKPLKDGAPFCTACGTLASAAVPAPAAAAPARTRPAKKVMSARTKMAYAGGVIVIFSVFLYLFADHLPGGAHPVVQNQPMIAMATMYMGQVIKPTAITASVEDGHITFPLSALQEHKLIEFEYRTESTIIPLMAYISAEGKLVTSVRMCEPCNSDHFRIEGMELACGKCETKWKLNNLEGIQGACQKYPPDPVPSVIRQHTRTKIEIVSIDEQAVRRWKMRI